MAFVRIRGLGVVAGGLVGDADIGQGSHLLAVKQSCLEIGREQGSLFVKLQIGCFVRTCLDCHECVGINCAPVGVIVIVVT